MLKSMLLKSCNSTKNQLLDDSKPSKLQYHEVYTSTFIFPRLSPILAYFTFFQCFIELDLPLRKISLIKRNFFPRIIYMKQNKVRFKKVKLQLQSQLVLKILNGCNFFSQSTLAIYISILGIMYYLCIYYYSIMSFILLLFSLNLFYCRVLQILRGALLKIRAMLIFIWYIPAIHDLGRY